MPDNSESRTTQSSSRDAKQGNEGPKGSNASGRPDQTRKQPGESRATQQVDSDSIDTNDGQPSGQTTGAGSNTGQL